MKWAWRFVSMVTARMLYQASVYVHDNEFDRLIKRAMRQIRDIGKGRMPHSRLIRNMHVDSDTLRRILTTLEEAQLIVSRKVEKEGTVYFLAE